jgi:predicted metal-binding membrane protein
VIASLFGAAHVHGGVTPGLPLLAAMWTAMMALMMAPTAWPWLRTFQRLTSPASRGARAASTSAFVGGYGSAWLTYSVAAAGCQLLVLRAGWLSHDGALPPTPSAVILTAAGAFQFTPWKRACLTHCRNPLSFLLTRWRNGPIGGYRLGLSHGWFCVGCCWALMATTFAVGLADVRWMLVLTAVVFAEQAAPRGDLLRPLLGVALIVFGVSRLAL